jgi:hypothetical protein
MKFEVIEVRLARVEADRLHALHDTTVQTGSLVGGEIEASGLPQMLEQLLETVHV